MKQVENKIPVPNMLPLSEAMERLVQLFDAWDKPDQAARWRKELEAYKKPAGEPAQSIAK
jgi:hypothetical protein